MGLFNDGSVPLGFKSPKELALNIIKYVRYDGGRYWFLNKTRPFIRGK